MADGNPFATTAPNPFVSFLTAFNNGSSGNQGTQGTPSSQPGGQQQGLIGQVVTALMKRAQQSPGVVTAPGTYEGNIPSQANPYSGGGQYGMPGGGDPWSQGTAPVPYSDPTMQALFSQPPTS